MQSTDLAERFIAAVNELERTRNIQPVVDLFADNAVLYNPIDINGVRGTKAIRRFWQNYIDSFADVKSRFNRQIMQEGTIVLEWLSSAHLSSSHLAVQYAGVTILQHDGNRIQQFNTYYDTARLTLASSSAALQRQPEAGGPRFQGGQQLPPEAGSGD